jgi:hypothetical protein
MNCRHCQTHLEHVFLDLGFAPPSNAYLSAADLTKPEGYYPLKLYVCEQCWLVQTEDYVLPSELFGSNYAYFSSVSSTWLDHAAQYCDMIISRLKLDANSLVIEVAANDGYLLKNFVLAGIQCLGIEPTDSTADVAERLKIPILREFFSENMAAKLVTEGYQADLIIGNNVYAHVPDINDFTQGLKTVLKPSGTITLEFPHLMRLLEYTQFDTVYHEHFSYFSLYTVSKIFSSAGLRVYDLQELSTHGGSLRVYGCHENDDRKTTLIVGELLNKEARRGLRDISTYKVFQSRCNIIKNDLLIFLIEQQRAGKIVVAYGAAAKGCTLLNYAGIKADLMPFVCDSALSKQGRYLPGSHIPICHQNEIKKHKPDFVLILPWNIKEEIKSQLSFIKDWGGRFIVAVPSINLE